MNLCIGALMVANLFLHTAFPQIPNQEKNQSEYSIHDLKEEIKKIRNESKIAIAEAKKEAEFALAEAKLGGHNAWMLTSSALVMFMVPGLALFYGGMVQRKNILATMMQSMASLAIVGVFWLACGYGLAFGPSILLWNDSGLIGWHNKFFFLQGVEPSDILPGSNTPVYTHVLFQGMFAIIAPAIISGAVAERIRFLPFTLFSILWVMLVYCPLAHMVWAYDWFYENPLDKGLGLGGSAIGLLAKWGTLDFAGGIVVHISAGFAGLACTLALRKRIGFPNATMHPNSMVLTLLGTGLLWFGWFGFNGGSAIASNALATSAFGATQAAAASAGLIWMAIEWYHKGKPTALGLASGIIAGLGTVTPASGFIYIWGGLLIGLIAGAVCYVSVQMKNILAYDDSLDAFGIHGVGGFLGTILIGVFCFSAVNSLGADGLLANTETVSNQLSELQKKPLEERSSFENSSIEKLKNWTPAGQLMVQTKASIFSALYAFIISYCLAVFVQLIAGFSTDFVSETDGLDETEHGESGFDFGTTLAYASGTISPRAASSPPNGAKRFSVLVDGAKLTEIMRVWSDLCQTGKTPPHEDFRKIYPFLTTISGNKFNFLGGDPSTIKDALSKLFQEKLNAPVKATLE